MTAVVNIPPPTPGGLVLNATSAYDAVNDRLGIGQSVPAARLHVRDAGTAIDTILAETTTTTGGTFLELKAATNRSLFMIQNGQAAAGSMFGSANMNSIAEIRQQGGNGLKIGTKDAAPMELGTNNILSLSFDATTAQLTLAAVNRAANAAVATVLGSVGPTGAATTVQEWMTVKGAAGAARFIPMF